MEVGEPLRISNRGMNFEQRRFGKPVQRRQFSCNHCRNGFQTVYSLKKHIGKFHSQLQSTPTGSKRGAKCPLCTERTTKVRLYDHFARDHQIKLAYETKVFTNLEQFLCWKAIFEKETRSKFVCYATHLQGDRSWNRTYNCQRTGNAIVKPSDNRVYKVREAGSNKINGFCPARISLRVQADGSAEAVICKTHVGHGNALGRLTLTKEERTWLASRIAAGISFSDILDEIRDTIRPEKLERLHLTTRKDLHNIAQQFNLTENDVFRRIDSDCSAYAPDSSCEWHDEVKSEPLIGSDEESEIFPQQSSPSSARAFKFQLVANRNDSKVNSEEQTIDHAESATVIFMDNNICPSEDSEISNNIFQDDNIVFVVVDKESCSEENSH